MTIKEKLSKTLPLLAFIIPLAVYITTACPTVFVGDSGEMITAAYYLGIPHPPGYPLYTISGWLMSWLPFGTIAYRINLTAGVFGALAIIFMFYFLKNLAQGLFPKTREKNKLFIDLSALFISLAFAFSFTFWNQALMNKGGIYTLNLLIMITALNLLLKMSIKEKALSLKNFILLGVICGLGLANHNTMAPLTVVFILYALALSILKALRSDTSTIETEPFQWKNILNCILLPGAALLTSLFVSALLYSYLYIRANTDPVINWGNPENWDNIVRHVLRQQYSIVNSGKRSIAHFFVETKGYGLALLRQNNFFLLLAPLGAAALFFRTKKYLLLNTLVFLATSAGLAVFANFYLNSHDLYIMDPFFIPSFFILAVFSAAAVFFLFEKTMHLKAAGYIITALLLANCIFLFNMNHFKADKSKNTLAYKYGVNLFKTVKKDGILFTAGDNATFITCYLSRVEKLRPDITLQDDTGNVFSNIYGKDFHRLVFGEYYKRLNETQMSLINSATTPVYCVTGSNLNNSSGFILKPDGVLFRILKNTTEKIAPFPVTAYDTSLFEDKTFFKDFLNRELISLFYFAMAEGAFDRNMKELAETFYKKAEEFGGDMATIQNNLAITYIKKENYKEAIRHAKMAIETDPRFADAYNNLGICYYKTGDFEQASKNYLSAIAEGPRDSYFYNLGQLYRNTNNSDGAIEAYKNALIVNPFTPKANYVIGNSYLDKGEYDLAIQSYLAGLKNEPDSYEIYTNLGVAYEKKGMFREAAEALKTSIKLNPKVTESRYGLGSVLQKQGDLKGALDNFNQSVQINPNFAEGWNAMGLLLTSTGNYKDAAACFKNLTILRPNDVEAWNNLGIACGSNGEIDPAIKAWEKALELNPKYSNARKNIELIRKRATK